MKLQKESHPMGWRCLSASWPSKQPVGAACLISFFTLMQLSRIRQCAVHVVLNSSSVVSGLFVLDHIIRAWALGFVKAFEGQPLEVRLCQHHSMNQLPSSRKVAVKWLGVGAWQYKASFTTNTTDDCGKT